MLTTMSDLTLPCPTLMRRVQGEFREMPGLKLTPAQAQRLFGLDPLECRSLLDVLTEPQFLRQTRDGSYVLARTSG